MRSELSSKHVASENVARLHKKRVDDAFVNVRLSVCVCVFCVAVVVVVCLFVVGIFGWLWRSVEAVFCVCRDG